MQWQWLKVVLAGICEILWVVGLTHSTNWIMWAITFILIGLSFYLVINTSKHLPVGTVYAVFTGIGAAGTVLVDMIFFGASTNILKIILIVALIGGIIGLKLSTEEETN
ncbi:paired small multidrug resistance pump [Staphylococcus auricularis]|uniref:Multidrug efflux SMR transporter n=1 Tax=Staphylococcus auricularis TaxID=29379 RepID=A0AAP8PPJ9_9STAP|nr:multidrug efflux SMR transporter [Staphylococcus auricularis]MBM0867339.1 QacE family quaternary ammonium compound efflux SMR transporter [Staphylococcus auricularis]MCE5038632.1 multidrug efflux SMR transporter [Staphylococcus auricularis]MDC6327613.1 multidrug efflux SMR transporter [Staphylococcus auricularis]MDN4533565.1 multidrug efflux SMR transporter [Staphylococcus auricularis]MEB6570127.1 multidrug efflux SMR transporter [Staphylococcus auricularis]